MTRRAWTTLILLPGLVALMAEPAWWLARTWVEPGYASHGGWIALLCLGLVLWSVASGRARSSPRAGWWALALLLGAAGVRLAGRVLDVSHVGALALTLDVVALGLLLGLRRRPRPVHPVALGGLFALALPVEQLVQHVLGFPLRLTSATAAEAVLRPLVPGTTREGTLLLRHGLELSIDLPCSGAQGLVLLTILALTTAAVRRVGLGTLLLGTLAVAGGALLGNTARVVALFLGPPLLLVEPFHSLLGLGTLALGALPALALTATLAPWGTTATKAATTATSRLHPALAALLSATFLAVALAPHRPVDVSAPIEAPPLPTHLGDRLGSELALSAQERAYLDSYGGSVERRAWTGADGGTHTALVVRTTAPVRHLHPARHCLLGAGHAVERLGVRPGTVPTTVWRSTAPDGRAWRVETSLVSARGEAASTTSEVVWRWMAAPGTAWSLVERITPWERCESDPRACAAFDRDLFTALDLELPS